MAGGLDGKVAVITGSTSGIGRATAALFAAEGAQVVVNGRREELGATLVDEIRSAGGDAAYFRADVRQADEVEALVRFATETYGRLDILMNNAFSRTQGSVLEVDEAMWDADMAILLKAIYMGCRCAIPEMVKGGGGSIINVASVHGLLAARRSATYEAAKGAIINLTRQMAVDFGPQGIRVNAICPGLVVVERTEGRFSSPETLRRASVVYPLRRVGRPLDIARAALFLASEDSSFVTGHALVVDGGMTVQLQDSLAGVIDRYVRETAALGGPST